MSRTINYVYVNILLDFPITYKHVYCFANQTAHVNIKTVNMVVSFLNMMRIPTQKGEKSYKCTEVSFKRKEGIEV